jgi:CBS domain-containing protein
MLRHLSEATQDAAGARRSTGASVADIMRRDLITVTPDTPTRDAVALIRKHRIGSLPVVQDGHIVAMLTEEDFVGIVSRVLDSTGNTGAPAPLPPEDTQ